MSYADIVVYSPKGEIVLIVESKNIVGKTREWAIHTRRNMLEHGTMPNSPYFMFALPDRFYLWKDAGITPELVEPTYEIDAYPFLRPYFEKSQILPNEIGYYAFDVLMTAWIGEFINWGISPDVPEEPKKLLQESGLREAVKNGKIVIPDLA